MDPAVRVEDILGDVFCVDTVNGISHILACGDNEGECHEQHHGDGVVEPKHWWIDVDMADFDKVLETTEDI